MILAASCSDNTNFSQILDNEKDELEVWDMGFDDNHKTFWLEINIKEDMSTSPAMLDDMDIVITELDASLKELQKGVQPKIINVHNIISDYISARGQKALIIADLTLSKESVKLQKVLTNNIREIFPPNNLYIAFIKGNELTKTYPVTNYVIDSMFVATPENAKDKKLFRAMVSKLDEMNGKESDYYPSVQQHDLWASLTKEQKVLIVLSDGRIYADGLPIDNAHFELQQRLLEAKDNPEEFPVFYVNYKESKDQDTNATDPNAEDLMHIITKRSGGNYITTSPWLTLTKNIMALGEDSCADIRVTLENPDYKVYRGQQRWLRMEFINCDTVYASGIQHYSLGSVYKPIRVNGMSEWNVIIQGMLFSVCLLLIVYLILQYIVPWIKYRIFLKKYVTKYSGRNMSFNGIQVDEVCYFCKAPFCQDDEIVAKCEHVMHKSCWDENEYKCPEFGKRCKTGRHYYNTRKLSDSLNAPYYTKWLIAGICAGTLAWLFFILNLIELGHEVLSSWISDIPNLNLYGTVTESDLASRLEDLTHTPYFGLYICFFLTLLFSILSSHGHWWWKRAAIVLCKAIIAGICGFATFVLSSVLEHVLNIPTGILLLDWIPWTANGFIIAYAVSLYTDIKLSKALLGALLSIFFGLGSMYIWDYALDAQMDSRDLLLCSSLIYSTGLAITLASQSPRSERYFLKVEGPIKTMEIALYKWMNSQAIAKRVTIGKSVNCNLQMSWDIKSSIAPVHAELVSSRGNIYLIARESGVYKHSKELKLDERIKLHHGDKFTIGQTKFTYVEHDT